MEVIAAAHGDGQLTLEEYQERVAGVREADSAPQMERWTHDLQTPDPTWQESMRAGVARGVRRVAGWLHAGRAAWGARSRVARAVAIVLTMVVIGSLVWMVRNIAEDADGSTSGLTSGLDDFREAYEQEFLATEVSALQIDSDYVRFEVLVESDPPRSQVWAWQDGSFDEVGGVSGTVPGVVDLAEIDVDAVDDALDAALPDLGVSDPSQVTTIIRPAAGSDRQQVTLVVRNEFDESGRLVLDLDGAEIRREPFEEPGQG